MNPVAGLRVSERVLRGSGWMGAVLTTHPERTWVSPKDWGWVRGWRVCVCECLFLCVCVGRKGYRVPRVKPPRGHHSIPLHSTVSFPPSHPSCFISFFSSSPSVLPSICRWPSLWHLLSVTCDRLEMWQLSLRQTMSGQSHHMHAHAHTLRQGGKGAFVCLICPSLNVMPNMMGQLEWHEGYCIRTRPAPGLVWDSLTVYWIQFRPHRATCQAAFWRETKMLKSTLRMVIGQNPAEHVGRRFWRALTFQLVLRAMGL